MFVLVKIRDKIRIDPKDFNKEIHEAVEDEIHKKYSNKILPNQGLCISCYQVDEVGDPYIIPNDGGSWSEVIFRLVVFRPFSGEVLTGRITKCDYKTGVHVSMDFFDDIVIPPHLLQEGSDYDFVEQLWYWKFGEHELYLDTGEMIRFMVNTVHFDQEQGESKPPKVVAPLPPKPEEKDKPTDQTTQMEEKHEHRPLMTIIGRINEDGLGLVSWWSSQDDDKMETETEEKSS